jgi:hypothetical protein
MARDRYRNVVLSMMAILLGWGVWAEVSRHGGLVSVADAQLTPSGIPNAAQQRKEMLDELRSINRRLEGLSALLEGGRARIIVANADELAGRDGDRDDAGKREAGQIRIRDEEAPEAVEAPENDQ